MVWILGGIGLVVLLAGAALQFAIWRNGPAVLSTVDAMVGGSRDAERMATIATGDHPQQKVIVWGPKHRDPAAAPAPVLVFAHGGSWRNGDPVDYGFIGRTFVPKGFIVVLVGYRLSEDGRYPAMLEDTARAVAWTHEEIADYGGDPDHIVLAGHSAGAYNVVMTALEEQWLARLGQSTQVIKGVVGMSGPYDFVPLDSDSTIASFGHLDDPMVSQPAEHIGENAPPMLLVHGTKDTLVRPRNSRHLAKELRAQDNRVEALGLEDMDHNQPLIALAAPWRGNEVKLFDASFTSPRDPINLVDEIAAFAMNVAERTEIEGQTSVPVKAKTR